MQGPTKTMNLPVKLSPDELTKRGDELAHVIRKLEEMRAEEKERAKEAKEEITKVEHRVSDLAKIVRDGFEDRTIDVTEKVYYGRRVVETFRSDTGEIVSVRTMQDSEAQLGAFSFGDDEPEGEAEEKGGAS